MAVIDLNVGFATPAFASAQATNALRAESYGFDGGFRVDGSIPDSIGTYPGTPDYSGIDAFCEAFAPLGKPGIIVIYPYAPDLNSWSIAQGGSLCSRYMRWSSPGDMAMMDNLKIGFQNGIDRYISEWEGNGGALSNLWFQWGNEFGIGGGGGPVSYASNHGKYDIYSDLAGTVSSPGYFRAQCAANLLEGTVPTDADFDALATTISRADVADLRGYHESCAELIGALDFGGCKVIGGAFEHQISPWGASATPLALLGDNTIASRERATYFAHSYHSNFSANAFNLYIGDHSAVGGITPYGYARNQRRMIHQAVKRFRTTGAYANKPIYITECGIVAPWIPSVTQEKRGEYWAELIAMFRSLTCVERVAFYRLSNYSAGEDLLNSSTNYGTVLSTGNTSAGAKEIYKANGRTVPSSPIGGGSYSEGSSTE